VELLLQTETLAEKNGGMNSVLQLGNLFTPADMQFAIWGLSIWLDYPGDFICWLPE